MQSNHLAVAPIIIVVLLAALAMGIVMLWMIFSPRFRAVGVGMLALTCIGAVVVAGMFLLHNVRSASLHRQQAEMARVEILSHAEAAQTQFNAARNPRPQIPIGSALQMEVAGAEAEFASDASFDDPTLQSSDSTETDDQDSAAPVLGLSEATAESAELHSDSNTELSEPENANYQPAKPWLVETEEFEYEGSPAKVVSSAPAPDVMTCVEDLTDKLASECCGYVRSYTPWGIQTTPELISCAIRDEYVESIGDSQKVVHKLLVFDRDFKQQADIEINRARMKSRLGFTGVVSGVVLSTLTGLFGIFSFTHRRRERRLSSQQAAGE